ncbi:uncharacterized protein LOC121854302 [Homarus americanus]|uniref:uncharacterized protein LOC121854302 n=1 Tax=Homarus americanus TaxID=6706 RepID=UPI001C45B20E|nr:uncharacterized protein LOC121854302 [Homarus americanus]
MLMEFNCPDGQVCDGTKFCKAVDQAEKCQCSATSNLADPYDSQKYYLCVAENELTELTCGDNELYDDASKTCAAATCTEIGFFPLLPSCTSHYACTARDDGKYTASNLKKCTDKDTVYDSTKQMCVAKTGIQLPDTPKCPGDASAVMDPVMCNAFHVCSSTTIAGPICCPNENLVFNSATNICEENTGQTVYLLL